jgi:3-oxoacyl-[acyl-carrier-protein] synthase III
VAFLSAIGKSSGISHRLTDAAEAEQDRNVIQRLIEDGFDRFVIDERPVFAMLAEAASQTLAAADVDAARVEAVYLATESFWDVGPEPVQTAESEHRRFRVAIQKALHDAGLQDAFVYGHWLSSCANFLPTLGTACAAVDGGSYQTALVIIGDRHPPTLARLMGNGAAVYSDVAVACLLTRERRPGSWLVGPVVSHASLRTDAAPTTDFAALVLETRRALAQLERRYRTSASYALATADVVVVNNFDALAVRVMTDTLGIDASKIRTDSKPLIAHGYAADNLYSLGLIAANGGHGSGRRVALFNTAVRNWNLCGLTAA